MTPVAVTFFCAGVPLPKGSGKAIPSASTGRPIFVPSRGPEVKVWQTAIALEARAGGVRELGGYVEVRLRFFLPRPRSHYTKTGALKASAPSAPGKKPDADKLTRAVLDALTGVAYRDDGQVTAASWLKRWATPEQEAGVRVTVAPDVTA